MYAFDQVNYDYFSKKDLKSQKPEGLSWRFDTIYSAEVREMIIKDTCEMLIHQFALQSASIGFPELVLPA